jgi:cell division protein ZapA (FtsZ GTPase activity inhibitor)
MNNKIVDIKIINKDYNINAPPNTPEDISIPNGHIIEKVNIIKDTINYNTDDYKEFHNKVITKINNN